MRPDPPARQAPWPFRDPHPPADSMYPCGVGDAEIHRMCSALVSPRCSAGSLEVLEGLAAGQPRRSGCAATKARTHAGWDRAWSRSAQPIALRLKKSGSAMLGSMTSARSSWSSRSLRADLADDRRPPHPERVRRRPTRAAAAPRRPGAASRVSRTRWVATSSTTSHHAPVANQAARHKRHRVAVDPRAVGGGAARGRWRHTTPRGGSTPSQRARIVASHCSRDVHRERRVGEEGAQGRAQLRRREAAVGDHRLHVALLPARPIRVGVLLERGADGRDQLGVRSRRPCAHANARRARHSAPRIRQTRPGRSCRRTRPQGRGSRDPVTHQGRITESHRSNSRERLCAPHLEDCCARVIGLLNDRGGRART